MNFCLFIFYTFFLLLYFRRNTQQKQELKTGLLFSILGSRISLIVGGRRDKHLDDGTLTIRVSFLCSSIFLSMLRMVVLIVYSLND